MMGLIDSVVTCQELCEDIVTEAERVINTRLANSVTIVSDDDQAPKAPPAITPHWLLQYTYVDNVVQERKPYLREHMKLIAEFKKAGRFVMGGVLGDLSGATVIFKNKEDADEFASRDPFVENGIVTNYEVKEWSVV